MTAIIKNKINKFSYYKLLLTYILVAVPAAIFFPGRQTVYILLYIIFLLIAIKRFRSYTKHFLLFFLLICILLILQTAVFSRFSIESTLAVFIAVTFPYFIIRLIGKDFLKYYIQLMLIVTLVSFIFYFPSLISYEFHNSIGSIAPTLKTDYLLDDQNFIIYTWENYTTTGVLRNSGIFTEPGSFASYLTLALLLSIVIDKRIFSIKNNILMLGIVTTLSTAGFIALFIILTGYALINRNFLTKIIISPIILFISFFAFQNLDFLEPKLNTQYYSTLYGQKTSGRFYSAQLDLIDIQNYPLTGRGLTKTTRFDNVEYWARDEAPRSITNGLTDLIVRLGLVGFTIYVLLLSLSLKCLFKKNKFSPFFIFITLAALFIVAFGQTVLLNAPFVMLLFYKDIQELKLNNNGSKKVKNLNYNP